jgi:hypothetical protein
MRVLALTSEVFYHIWLDLETLFDLRAMDDITILRSHKLRLDVSPTL